MSKTTIEDVMKEINQLTSEYEFPLNVLMDIEKRLADSSEVSYAQQQLRYLNNLVSQDKVSKK